jgi:hypothetical protein
VHGKNYTLTPYDLVLDWFRVVDLGRIQFPKRKLTALADGLAPKWYSVRFGLCYPNRVGE